MSYRSKKKRSKTFNKSKVNKHTFERREKFNRLIKALNFFKVAYKYCPDTRGTASLYILSKGIAIVRISDHDYNPKNRLVNDLKASYHKVDNGRYRLCYTVLLCLIT